MNWIIKVAIQSVLARIPGGEAINHKLQWLNGQYTPQRLKSRTLNQARILRKLIPYCQDTTIVEVGTGWELIAPVLFYLFGARQIYTYDHLRHLRFETPRMVIEQLNVDELSDISAIPRDILARRIENLKQCSSIDDLLNALRVTYCAPADGCNTGLPDHSVDLFFTYEVLEHIPKSVLEGLMVESKRILKHSGIAYHAIEPGDHYTRDVSHINHLRYPEWLWLPLIKNSISYHNRLCEQQFLNVFTNYGAKIIYCENKISERDLRALKNGFPRDKRFCDFTPEELAIFYSEIIYCFPSERESSQLSLANASSSIPKRRICH